jgi:hypothetical protein
MMMMMKISPLTGDTDSLLMKTFKYNMYINILTKSEVSLSKLGRRMEEQNFSSTYS